jgi:hypothetical protein
VKFQTFRAGLAVAAATAMLGAATSAYASASAEESFTALRAIDAEPLSPAEMQAITGGNALAIAAALNAAAARASSPTVASTLTSLAAAYSRITVPTSRLFINRVLVRR